MATIVFPLWYEREYPDREDTELSIGTFSTRKKAEQAVAMLIGQPGFRDYPAGFKIYELPLDRIAWKEGFFSTRQSEWREDWEPKTKFLDYPRKMRPGWTSS